MLFNSVEFLFFLIIVFTLFWFVAKGKHRLQNFILLAASCIFYMFFIPKYILILLITILIDYAAGIFIERSEGRKRKVYLVVSIISTCLVLFVFKYYNFFIENFNGLAEMIGWNYSVETLKIILPIGLSFHTFQSLSYVIEVYHRKQKAETNFMTYSLYVMFFPQLVAGPIERPANLLNQLKVPVKFDYTKAVDGMRLILWGLFKKVVIADTCAVFVNHAFAHYNELSGPVLLMGAVYFAFQIYGDFSGYSDIARGTARLFGYELMINFRFPYFSRDIAEFWRRWHISLSTWFRDYVYFPLGGSRVDGWKKFRNILIIFLVSGFWHGANWTFIAWGALHALYYIPVLYMKKNRDNINTVAEHTILPTGREWIQMLFTFFLVCIAWIFFRAENMDVALGYLGNMFSQVHGDGNGIAFMRGIILLIPFIIVEWIHRRQHDLRLFDMLKVHPYARIALELVITILVIDSFCTLDPQQFIYFQF